ERNYLLYAGRGSGQRHSAGAGDQVGSVSGGGVVHESLGHIAQLLAVGDDEVEVTLDGIALVQNGLLGGLDAAHGDGLDGVIHSGQGSVADGVGVGSHVGDDFAG